MYWVTQSNSFKKGVALLKKKLCHFNWTYLIRCVGGGGGGGGGGGAAAGGGGGVAAACFCASSKLFSSSETK